MNKIDEGLKTARNSYNEAFKKLKTGGRSLINTAQKFKAEKSIVETVTEIKKLGADVKNKKLPIILDDLDDEEKENEVLQAEV